MTQPYPAALYAALHLGNPGDLDFYRARCRGADSVLELGCGYGRVLEALATEGLQVTGLDASRELLALAEARLQRVDGNNGALVLGDMRQFAFDQKFDRILIPYSGLFCLTSQPDVEACLQNIALHLRPGGQFIFDAYSADNFHDDPEQDENPEENTPEDVATISHEGITYHVTEQSQWWRDEQRMDVVYVHEPRQGGHTIAAPLQHRYLLSRQIEPLLNRAGLDLVSLHGDYDGTPFTPDADLLVVVARLA
jgi:SAM-dependent methyltransferase